MDCYYWFLCASKKLSKALFYVNKALAIDNQNRLYWKRYATINKHMNFFEEAEFGFRRRLNLGYRTRYVVVLGWYSTVSWWIESAIQTLLQATEFYPEENEIEYRLAGIYFMIQDTTKLNFIWAMARLNFDNYILIEDLFQWCGLRKQFKPT
jgi:tetratricopeptide (TPR) repeat protein